MGFSLEASIIRVLNPEGNTIGAGFLIAPGLAVTCAHVVDKAKSAPGQVIALANLAKTRNALVTVLESGWSPSELDDLAFLQLDLTLDGLATVTLGPSVETGLHPYLLMGFPPDESYTETWLYGMLHGRVGSQVEGRQPILELSAAGALQGMSGAPVFDMRS